MLKDLCLILHTDVATLLPLGGRYVVMILPAGVTFETPSCQPQRLSMRSQGKGADTVGFSLDQNAGVQSECGTKGRCCEQSSEP